MRRQGCVTVGWLVFLGLLAVDLGVGAEPVGGGLSQFSFDENGTVPLTAEQPGATADAAAPEAAALVRQLGDDSYEVRFKAARQLVGLGLKAREALTAGLKDADAEVRRQCRWILGDVLETDFQQRLEAFKADTEDKQKHDIPGWERYRQVIGGDAKARELFVEMQRAENGLLESAAAGPAAAVEGLGQRLDQVFRAIVNNDGTQQRRQPSLGTTAALLFVVSDPQLDLPQNVAEHQCFVHTIQQPEFHQALSGGPFQPAARKLLGQWIRCSGGLNLLHYKLNLALQYQIKEGLDVAMKVAKDQQPNQQHFRMVAIGVIGKLGGKEYAAALDALLADQTDIFRGQIAPNKQTTVQVRDVALAWLVYLTGQDHAAYGQDQAKQEFENLRKNAQHTPNFPQLGFAEPAKRDEALKKWREYVAEHPLPKLPEPAAAAKPAVAKAAAAPAAAAHAPKEESDNPLRSVSLPMADRLLVQSLTMARELCGRGQYAEAVRLLDRILAAQTDYAFQPDRTIPLVRCLKPEAERLVGELPTGGRDEYQLQCEAMSQRILAEAVKAGSVKAIAAVAERFFHTQAGADATFLLAAFHQDRGHPFHAALYLERLHSRSNYADRLEPALSLALAACWARAGMPRAADEVLRKLHERGPQLKVRIAGEDRALFGRADRRLGWLESFAGPMSTAAIDGWLLYGGAASRNAAAEVGTPFLQAKPLVPICDNAELRQIVEKLRKEQTEQFRVGLPRSHPLVVGGTIVLRTATYLTALEAAGGKLLWEAKVEDSLRERLERSGNREQFLKQLEQPGFVQAVRRRFWEDLTFGTLSSDGCLVFGVEDVSFGFATDYQRKVVGPDGRRRLDTELIKKHNLLSAHDLRTGKLRWEIGGSPGPGMLPMAGTCFLGPPLPLGGRLYVVVDDGADTRLLELDAPTGVQVSELTLASREQQSSTMMFFPQFAWMAASLARVRTSSPAYADGVMVCRAAEGQYVGVDLTTRRLLWIYQFQEEERGAAAGWMFGVLQQRKMMEAADPNQVNRWADAGVTIAAGRVLLTPADGNELVCLNLADGRFEWSAPRRDGVYLAGVDDGRAIIVGRGSVWALNLTDGKSAWTHDLDLPPGSLPSGRGLMGHGRYTLPLSTGEVAVIDLGRGRLISRSRSPDGIVPGNLVPCGDAILSQSAEGLWRFETLSARDRRLAAALAEHPDDPGLLAERGEVLLCGGQIAEAVALLRRAMELKPEPRTRAMLSDALMDGLQVDFERFSEQAGELDSVIEQTEGRPRFLRELARGMQQAGRFEAAFAAYLKLIDADAKLDQIERFETARTVRRDRWLAARLAEVQAAAAPEHRADMDKQIAARLARAAVPAASGEQDALALLRQFLSLFGSHPSAHDARLRLARQLVEKKQWLEAEQLLRQVLRSGSPEQQHEAAARLALLLREAKQVGGAARFYAYLGGDLAGVVCLEGKTGRQLFEALPADDPVRRAVSAPFAWPAGKVRVEMSDKRAGNMTRFGINVLAEGGRFDPGLCVEVDAQNRKLLGSDPCGRPQWQLAMAEKDQNWNFPFGYPDPCSQVWPLGHLLVGWVGNNVAAIDTFDEKAKALWCQNTVKSHPNFGMIGLPMRVRRMQMGQAQAGLPGADPLPLAITGSCACFLQDRNLRAIDLISGQVLWTRDDAVFDSSLFGDEELLLVTPPDSTEATVFSVLDGREVGRCRVPESKDRLLTQGRRVATWKSTEKNVQLTMLDPWARQTLWQRDFAPKAQPWLIEGEEVAVLDPQGRLAIVSLATGEPLLLSQLDAQPKLDGLLVQRSTDCYVVVAKEPAAQNQAVVFMQPFMGHHQVNGRVYGLSRRTGKLLWSTNMEKQGLRLVQPGDLPVLTFFNQVQVMEGQTFRMHLAVCCLDKRSGRILYSKESKDHAPNVFEIQAEPEKSAVEVRTHLGTARMTFTDEAEKDAAPAK